MKSELSDEEINGSILNDDEKINVSGYVDADGNCSFNSGVVGGAVGASYVAYENNREVKKGKSVVDEPKEESVQTEERTTSKGTKYKTYTPIKNARVSGDCSSIIATPYKAKGGDVKNLRIHGDDVHIIIETKKGMSELSATFLGDDSYDIEELDDGADIFTFDVGDVVSGDDIRMVLVKLALER